MRGWRLLLTRPADECAALAAQLTERAVFSSSLPLLAITPLPETPQQRDCWQNLARYSAVIVVSKPAARLALQCIEQHTVQVPVTQAWFTVGAATAEILQGHGLSVHYPPAGDDSEALLALPALQHALTQAPSPRVLILRGDSGRELLAERLGAMGVQVDYLALYQRSCPAYPPGTLAQRIRAERLNGLVVSSGQGFTYLHELAGDAWEDVRRLPLFVPSPRVAELARAAGAERVVDCRGASASALLAALQAQPAPITDAKDGYVSETTVKPAAHELPPQPDSAHESPVSPPANPPAGSPPARGNGLALLALLIGAAGLAAGAWGTWQVRMLSAETAQQSTQIEASRSDTQSVGQQLKRVDERLGQLPSAAELDTRQRLLAQLQGDQQLLNQRLETVLGASRQDWRLAEAEHLLRLASLRLSALQDVNSAEALVNAADQILREQNDPAAFAAREQVARAMEALRTTVDPDRTGLFLQLGALREQVAELNALTPTLAGEGGVLEELAAQDTSGSWWSNALQRLSQYIRIEVGNDEVIRPVLAGQNLTQVRLALGLALEQAQWGALHGETGVYQQALKQGKAILATSFDQQNPASRALLARLTALEGQAIEVQVPDLAPALGAVQAYIEQKHSMRETAQGASEAAAEGSAEDARP